MNLMACLSKFLIANQAQEGGARRAIAIRNLDKQASIDAKQPLPHY